MAKRPLQNRVLPNGDVVAIKARGHFMGNRGGRLHGPLQTLQRRRWASKAWICCVLRFRQRHRQIMAPNSYTELFFLDEVTALAAGHRPCFECRHHDAVAFADSFSAARKARYRMKAKDIDTVLHESRLDAEKKKRTYLDQCRNLPYGTIVKTESEFILLGDHKSFWQWHPSGYKPILKEPMGTVEVLTPKTIVETFREGYRPTLHHSAQ